MIKTGKRCKIGSVKVLGKGEVILGDDVTIGNDVVIDVTERLVIGDRSIIGDHFIIEGRDIEIGKEFWSGRFCQIGGGSCKEKLSQLRIGYQCHLGNYGSINTARPVIIGNEVGLGEGTKIYTHGAYENVFMGFPVDFGPVIIEDRVWCPNAMIMPNVTIGHDTVVGAGAIVTKSLPAGCLAVGIPAKVIRADCYPKKTSDDELTAMLTQFIDHFKKDILTEPETFQCEIHQVKTKVFVDGTLFHLGDMRIDGRTTVFTEKFRNELRRYGVRFKYYPDEGIYKSW